MDPINLFDYEVLARKALEPASWGYYEGGSDDDITLRANRLSFERIRLRPHVLRDVSNIDVNTTVQGMAVRMPTPGVVTWETVRWLRSLTSLPLLLKGIVTAEDALVALEYGINGIVVSNHGGRQLDGTVASIDALPEVARAVAGQCEVYLDGGIRRGTDVLKALALGAHAVLVGRPILWGLAVNGLEGVQHVLELLYHEFTLAMALAGCPTLESIDHSLIYSSDRDN